MRKTQHAKGFRQPPRGQGLIEYSLVLLLVAVVVTAGVILLGPKVGNIFSDAGSLEAGPAPDPATPIPEEEEEPANAPILETLADFRRRINEFYAINKKWPRSFSAHAFTDLGLSPSDWKKAVHGIFWNPHGSDVGLANKAGDDFQVYVRDLSGKTLHLYDGWNIWCMAASTQCYYHKDRAWE
ncbi:MAG: hypothetical protein FJZ96_02040 [Chloroflexi bacterium]|nr:hypothetical protein [Chloroflexota bacterium]